MDSPFDSSSGGNDDGSGAGSKNAQRMAIELPGPNVREHVLRDWVHHHRAVEFIHTASPATVELM
jgi:hypothetical protein